MGHLRRFANWAKCMRMQKGIPGMQKRIPGMQKGFQNDFLRFQNFFLHLRNAFLHFQWLVATRALRRVGVPACSTRLWRS